KAETRDFVSPGDIIELRGRSVRKIKPLAITLPIVFQDEHLVVADKPGGMAVNGNRYKTVENAVADLSGSFLTPGSLSRPVAVHRLDVPTSGLVLLARTKKAQILLSRAFQERRVTKKYLAVVHGKPATRGRISTPIDGKSALTRFHLIRSVPSRNFGHLSLLELTPVTGRTHQLRIHLRDMGHLIVGDKLYAGQQKTILGKGLLLCASELIFEHPITRKNIKLRIDSPAKFTRLMDREAKRYASDE
ncbi:MAG: RluA family pseudouridine synthase, partial [Saprospiraceae bacterium]|nr:RluA family pseudouridine synthase [Saprospiraceae bacterium]